METGQLQIKRNWRWRLRRFWATIGSVVRTLRLRLIVWRMKRRQPELYKALQEYAQSGKPVPPDLLRKLKISSVMLSRD